MRLGGFYGFTAPMLLMVYDDTIKETLNTFNVKLNNTVAVELKKELWHFRRAIQNIKTDIIIKDDCLVQYNSICTVTNGNLTGSGLNDELKEEVLNALCNHCAKKLYEAIIAGKTFNLDGLDNTGTFNQKLYELVSVAMQGKSFALANVSTLQRAFIKLLKSENMLGDVEITLKNIKSFCNIEENVPDTLYIDDAVMRLTEDEIKVINYFKTNINKLNDADNNTHLVGFSDDNIFNISFIDFLNRKPSCLYYMIVRQFNHLKNSDIRLFPNILAKTKKEFAHCKDLINERLLKEVDVSKFVSLDELSKVFDDIEPDLLSFFKDIYDNLAISEISLDDLIKLKTLYYASYYLSIENMNNLWGTSFNYDSFNAMVKKMNIIGLGGINLYTHKLYKDSLKEIIFTNSSKINKSNEYMEELSQICDDIDAFLNTFLEIGGELSV